MRKLQVWICGITIICLGMSGSNPLHAQRRGNRGNNAEFERSAPAVGDPLPEVTVFDGDGNEFPLRSIKDNYSVIVFGCLT